MFIAIVLQNLSRYYHPADGIFNCSIIVLAHATCICPIFFAEMVIIAGEAPSVPLD